MLLTEFKAKDKAAILRCGGLAEGDITDEFEGGLGDTVAGLLCLDPRTPPSTAAKQPLSIRLLQQIVSISSLKVDELGVERLPKSC